MARSALAMLLLFGFLGSFALSAETGRPPNIVYILADDK